MFRYEYPEFNNKHLLKVDMLEQLRDYPRHYTQLLFQGQGNGIVNGCELSWSDDQLMINSGLVLWNGNLYFLEKPYTLECRPEDQLRYLVVKFLKETKHSDKVAGETCIYLRKEPVRTQDEMELCRFRLQDGSRLRSVYKDFQDYSTEYDTINIIHSPFTETGDSSISPKLLMCFAEEVMADEIKDSYDYNFCISVLSNGGKINRGAIILYLTTKGEKGTELKTNWELYQALLKLLPNKKQKSSMRAQERQIGRRIMLT